MEQSKPFEKLIWAIDPLVKQRGFQEVTANALRALSRSLTLSIRPVSVLLEAQIPYLVGPGATASDLKGKITRELEPWLRDRNIPGLQPLEVLIEKEFSVRAGVHQLVRYVRQNGFHLITAGTHAKEPKGASDKDLGTFSETLLLSSEMPLFFVNPRTKVPETYRAIFCATDLSAASLRNVGRVGAVARAAGLSMTLFHKLDPSPKDVIELSRDSEARTRFLETERSRREQTLRDVAQDLKERGVNVEVILDSLGGYQVSESIVARVNPSPGTLVAMVSHTIENQLGFPGSVTRQVLRQATAPVWIFPP